MFKSSGFRIQSREDFAAISTDELDELIRAVSSFSDWRAMLEEAVKLWTAKRLGF